MPLFVPRVKNRDGLIRVGGGRVTPPRRSILSRSLCILLFLGCDSHEQDKCNVEIKLLLSPTETRAAVASLNFEKETAGRVYFFDTSPLDLLAQGLIIRLRQGAGNDLTITLRPPGGAK